MYLCFAEPSTSSGVDCNAAATFLTFHSDGDIGKSTAGPAL